MAISIDTDIPVPAVYGKYSKYPFAKMEVGHSFLIDSNDDVASVRQAASHFVRRSKSKMKFSIRKTLDGFRCWRVE